MTHQQWDFLADAVNPALLVIFLACCIATLPGRKKSVRAFLSCFGLALLITYVFSHLPQWMHWWKNLGDFPSGHMAFYFTVATSFFLLDRRTVWFTVPLALLYGWLIVFLDYHTWLDLLGALVLALPVTLLVHLIPARPSA